MKKLTFRFSALLIWIGLLNFQNVAFTQEEDMTTDQDDDMLEGHNSSDLLAETAPAVSFGFVGAGNSVDTKGFTHWNHIVYGPDGRFYFAIGNHIPNGTVMLVAYDPSTKEQEILINSIDDEALADGKWHGRPVIHPETGDMYLAGFYRGQMVRYNIYDKAYEIIHEFDAGPVPEHIWDWQRNRFYGIGNAGKLLVYDIENDSVLFNDKPPGAGVWHDRSRMLDRSTGMFYGSDDGGTMLKYNPDSNKIDILDIELDEPLRAWTRVKEAEGYYWIFDRGGNVYKFYPEEETVEEIGGNLDSPQYVTYLERSPEGNYLYYTLATPSSCPVVQYDTQTGERKILAYLDDYYLDEYEYAISDSYGGALTDDGRSLLIATNGYYDENERPAIFHIHIPYSERTKGPVGMNNITSIVQEVRNSPNPFSDFTDIRFSLIELGEVTINIRDIHGRTVCDLQLGALQKGEQQVKWNRTNQMGNPVSPGIYLYSITVNRKVVATGKMVVVN